MQALEHCLSAVSPVEILVEAALRQCFLTFYTGRQVKIMIMQIALQLLIFLFIVRALSRR